MQIGAKVVGKRSPLVSQSPSILRPRWWEDKTQFEKTAQMNLNQDQLISSCSIFLKILHFVVKPRSVKNMACNVAVFMLQLFPCFMGYNSSQKILNG